MKNQVPAFGSWSTWAPNLIGNTLLYSFITGQFLHQLSNAIYHIWLFRHILQEFQLLHCICISLSSVIKSTHLLDHVATPWQHGDGRSLPHPPFATSAESMANGLTPVPHEHRIFDGTPGLQGPMGTPMETSWSKTVAAAIHMDVSKNSGFSPQIIRFNRVFHYKPSILRYPYFWKHPN